MKDGTPTTTSIQSMTASLSDLELQLAELEEHMSPLFTKRRELRERIAEIRPPAALPSRRNQTDTQRRIERCPRCGGRLPLQDETAP